MKKIAIILMTLVLAVPTFAQGRFGKDSAECTKYLSYYQELYKQKNYEEAAPFWRKAFSLCPPTASQNMLIYGQTIIRYEINKNRKVRAANYPNYAVKSLDNKAVDVANYLGSDYEAQYTYLLDVLDKIKGEARPVAFVTQMKAAVEMYRNQKLDAEGVMNNYTKISGYLDDKIDSSNDPEYRSA